VDRAVELLHVLRRARQFRDAVKHRLHLLGAMALGLDLLQSTADVAEL
jgi:hypothetical protein